MRSGDDIHIFFPARTRTTLRGWCVDCYLADEAQLITNEQWESAKPTMSARHNAQTWLFGTTPQLITDARGVRPAARARRMRAPTGRWRGSSTARTRAVILTTATSGGRQPWPGRAGGDRGRAS